MKRVLLIACILGAMAHAQLIPPNTAECATSTDGSVVGMLNPLSAPTATPAFVGTLPANNYFVVVTWYDAASHQTLPSPEQQVQLSGTGELQISESNPPQSAVGMDVYISTSSGTETLQGSITGTGTYIQNVPLVSGVAPPSTNNSVCQIIANDAGWPTGTGYVVGLTTPGGQTQPGYPMQWQILGPGTTLNISQGLPLYNGTVTYPVPILARPYGHATQSMSGGLNMGSYPFTSGYATLNSGGNFTGTFTGNPTFQSINFSNGFQLQGSYGNPGDLPQSTGTGTVWSPVNGPGGTPTVVAGPAAGTGATVSVVAGSKDKMGLIKLTTGTSPSNSDIVATLTFSTPFATFASCTIAQSSTGGVTLPTQILLTGIGTNGFTIFNQGPPALTGSLSYYVWSYICNGY